VQPLLQWKSNEYYTICSFSYPACSAHEPYCLPWPAPLYIILFTLSHKRYDFRKQVTEHKMCVLIFSTTLSEPFLILRRNERGMIKNVNWSSFKVSFNLVRFQWHSNFLYRISKNPETSNCMNMRPVGAEFFHAGGRTDMTKLEVALRNFSNAPINADGIQNGSFRLILNKLYAYKFFAPGNE